MRKVFLHNTSHFALLLLVLQLFLPIGSAFAINSSILPPSNLSVQQVTPKDVKLTWSSVYAATGYNVYEIKEGQLILLGMATSTSYALNNLEEGSYRYVVSTLSAEGESGPCAPVSFDIVYPDMVAPTTLTHTIKNENDIVLNWDSSAYAEKYNLYQIAEDGQETLITSTTSRTYTVSNAPEGSYTFSVSAINSIYGESPLSTPVVLEIVHPVLGAPNNFTFTLTNGNDVTLKWDPVSYATDYKIYKIIDGEKVLENAVTGTTLKYTNVSAGTYEYEIHSNSDRFGESVEGSQLTVEVGTITMVAPSNFSYTVKNINDVVLAWGSVPYATGYKIYQVIDGQKILKSTVTGTTVTYTKLPAGDYVYEVYSYSDRFGESSLGSQASFTIEAVAMSAPDSFNYEIQSGNNIVLSWASVANAENYKVYQIVNGQKVLRSTVTGTTVTYSNMPAGNYTYEVHSFSSRFGESEEGSQLSFELIHPTMQPPTNLVQMVNSESSFTLSWEASQYATNYKVYQIVNGQKVLKSTVSGTSVTYTNMASGEYNYVVHSYSSRFGESAVGAQLTFTMDGKVLAAPTNATYTIANGNDIKLTWTAVADATGYKIYQMIDGTKVLKNTVTGTSFTYTNLPEGNYHYVIHSYSTLFGESPEGTEVIVPLVLPIMEAPGNFAYNIQNVNSVVLSWGAVQYANSYKVYELVDGQKVLKNTVSTLSTTISNVPPGNHTYVVHSVSSRFGESPTGSEITLTLNEYSMQPPGNLTHSINNGNDITLKWDPVTNATGYKVYLIVDNQSVLQKTVTSTSVSFVNILENNYTYEVHSYSDRFGESPEGSQVSFEMVFPTMEAPGQLTNSITNQNDITLRWDAVVYAKSYNVYLIINGKRELQKTVTGTSVTFTKLPGGNYTYEVHSYSDRFGESPVGSQVSFELIIPEMKAPENLTYTITNGNDITLKWDPVTYATAYKVYQIIDGQPVLQRTVTSASTTFAKMLEGNYNLEVHSYSDRFGESQKGSQVSFDLVLPIMEAPANLTHTITNENYITLRWDAVTNATAYKVYKIVDGQPVLQKTVTGTSVTFTNMPEGNYTYEVHSYSDRFNESPAGSQVSFELIISEMKAPENLTQTIKNGNDITLKWDPVTYATAYKVYQIIDDQPILKRTVTSTSTTFTNMPEGDYSYEIHSYSDRFGESPVGSQVSFELIFPIMLEPENLTYSITSGNDITLKWDPVTYATAYKVYQIIDGQSVLQRTVTSASTTFTNMPNSNYTYEVHSYSDRFNESPEGSQVSFELIFPIMQAPENLTNSITNENYITLRWNASVYAKSYNVYQMIDEKPVLQKTVTGTSVTFTNMPEGDYTYEVHSYSDRFGESPEGSTVNFKLTWPTLVPPQLTGTVFNANNITLTWQKATWANEYRLYQITGDSKQLIYKGTALSYKVYNLTEDTHSFEVTLYSNRFGESKPSEQVVENIVYPIMQPPTANLKLLSNTSALILWDFVTYANGYNIYEMIDGNPILVAEKVNNLSYTVSNLSYKDHEYYVTSYSNSFGESAPSDIVLAKLIIDTEAPVTTTDAPSDWTNQKTVLTLSATDNETGVASTYYSLNDADFVPGTMITIEEEGVHKVSFYSVDKVGNTEQTQTIYIKVDQTAPVTKVNEVPTGYTGTFTLKLDATDEQSGVAKSYYSINGSEYVEGTSLTVDKEGVSEVSFYSIDQAGNIEEAQAVSVKIDKNAPVTTSDAIETWGKENVAVKLTAKDELSGVAKTYYSINSSEYVEGTSFIVEKEGLNKISFYSIDQAGNIEDAQTVSVKIDKTAPVTTSDASGNWSKENVTVNLAVKDELSGAAKTFYSINGSEYVEGTTLLVEKEGMTEITFYSIDQVGNIEEEKTDTVKIDKTAPVTTSNIPETWSKENVTVNLTAQDELSGVAKTFYSINGSEYVEGTSFLVDVEGINKISFYTVDNAGNIEKTQTVEVKIDKTTPIVSFDLNEEYKLGPSLPILYSANDDLSGIASEQVVVYGPNDTIGKTVTNGTSLTLDKPGVYNVNISVTNGAGLTTIVKKQFVVYIPGTIEVTPKVIKGNNGIFTVRVDLPKGYSSKGFDLKTAKLNGINALNSNNGYYNQAQNGQFKFERSDFNWTPSETTVEFRGYLDGYLVVGQTTVKVQK